MANELGRYLSLALAVFPFDVCCVEPKPVRFAAMATDLVTEHTDSVLKLVILFLLELPQLDWSLLDRLVWLVKGLFEVFDQHEQFIEGGCIVFVFLLIVDNAVFNILESQRQRTLGPSYSARASQCLISADMSGRCRWTFASRCSGELCC